MSIRNKLISVMGIVVVSILVNIYIVSHMLNSSENIQDTKLNIYELSSNLQQLQQNTNDFLEYKDLNYVQEFHTNYNAMKSKLDTFRTKLIDMGIETDGLEKVSNYLKLNKKSFEDLVNVQKKLGLSQKDGLYKSLYTAVKQAEKEAKKLQNQDIFSMVLTLRNLEKSFMISHNKKDLKKFKRSYKALIYFIDTDLNGEEKIKQYLAAYKKYFTEFVKVSQIKGFDSTHGILGDLNRLTEQNHKQFEQMLNKYTPILEEKINSLENISLIIQLIFGLIIIIMILFVIKSIVSPIQQLIDTAKNLTEGDGDLTIRLNTSSNDEIAEANRYINLFIEKVQTVLKGVINTSSENSILSDTLTKTVHEVENRSEKQNSELTDIVNDTNIIRQDLISAISEAEQGKENIIRSNTNLEETQKDILLLVNKVQDSSQLQLDLAESLSQLSDDAAQVKDVLTVISDIAEQTNLLALNAAIEAARAGEHGRGFAVVADEVRKLAERTQKSLTEINATVNVIVQAIVDSSNQMNINSHEIEKLASISTDVGDKINDTVIIMSNSSKMSENILNGYRDNAKKTDNIIDKIQHVSSISNENKSSIDNVAKVSTNLNEMTENLKTRLEEFKV